MMTSKFSVFQVGKYSSMQDIHFPDAFCSFFFFLKKLFALDVNLMYSLFRYNHNFTQWHPRTVYCMWVGTLMNFGLRDVPSAETSYYLADKAVFCCAIKMHRRHYRTPLDVHQFLPLASSRWTIVWFAATEQKRKAARIYLVHTYSVANNNNDISSLCFLWSGYLPYHIDRLSVENTASKETDTYRT